MAENSPNEPVLFAHQQPKDSSSRKKFILLALFAAIIVAGLFLLFAYWPSLVPGEAPSSFNQGYTEYKNVIRKPNRDFDIYLKHLFIVSAQGMVSENMLGQKVALVGGRLKNEGAQTLDVVELIVYLTDLDGKPIRSFLRTVVKPDKPLFPTEVRQFQVTLTPYPPEWTAAVVQTEIYGFRYKH